LILSVRGILSDPPEKVVSDLDSARHSPHRGAQIAGFWNVSGGWAGAMATGLTAESEPGDRFRSSIVGLVLAAASLNSGHA
jgi:hypothetical protein